MNDSIIQDEDEDDDGAQPFANLFARISMSGTDEGSGVPAPAPKNPPTKLRNSKPKSSPRNTEPDDAHMVLNSDDEKPPGAGRAAKARKTTGGQKGQPGQPVAEAEDGDMTSEDKETKERFEALVTEAKEMIPPCGDDQSFNQWSKDRVGARASKQPFTDSITCTSCRFLHL